MLPLSQLQLALAIQAQSYQLLRWVGRSLDRGVITFQQAHHAADSGDAALQWITKNYANIPVACRPDESTLPEFARFFSTYLDASFDLSEKTSFRRQSDHGCHCRFCSQLKAVSSLKAKKLTPKDKAKAGKLRLLRLESLAREEQMILDQSKIPEFLKRENAISDANISAYGWSLMARLSGQSYGSAILVLWRELAWKSEGSPKKNFILTAQLIHEAEQRLVAQLKTIALKF